MMERFRIAMLAMLFFTAPAVFGQTGNNAPFQRMTAPQIVTGGTIATDILLLNSASTTCNLGIGYHLGNGVLASTPLLTNGQDLGNAFFLDLPARGSQTLRVTTDGPVFQGAAGVDVLTPPCFNSVNVQAQYQIRNDQNRLIELFSYPIPQPVPLNSCASAPVNFDPDPADGQTNIPAVANVSFLPLSGVTRTMTLFDSQGNPIATAPPQTYNGQHDTGLLTNFFPAQGAFSGSWKVCFEGQQPPSAAQPIVIDTLFIDVVQTPNIVQFDSNDHSLENPGCIPDGRTLCLNDNRFRVQVEWSRPPQFDQPGLVQNVKQDDTGFFFFLDPDNTEFLIKVLDGCSFNDHFWVFYGATTNVEYTLTVTDTQTNLSQRFFNPLGQPADAIVDTQAFATCP